MGPIGIPELILILAIAALIFGAKRLPELGRGIGEAINNFKTSMKEPPKKEPDQKSLGSSAEEKER
ncbi:twin-arginine translocase TatA/TatE family subunit [bacterium]|nr:twin-arginine translocase TatA/TatE family subunit [bacterium]MCI0615337.1 twin-arginine translocase TatA/TatE family subunit [bacterium]